jgi:KRAB domain-containing zinc finger protein
LRKEFQSSEREKEKFSDLIREMKKCEKFFEIKEEPKDQKMTKNLEEKVKKDPEGNFLFLPFESPKIPKSIKKEVTRKEILSGFRFKNCVSEFQCKICQKYFKKQQNLNEHTERHFQPSSYECKKCRRIFKLKHHYDKHVANKCRKKEGNKICHFCHKSFSSVTYLKIHQRKVHKVESNHDWLSCDHCEKKFLKKSALKVHLETFQCRIRKIFFCDHCGKEFDEKKKILKHIQKHKIHKVECQICHIKVREDNLKRHMQTIHGQNQKVECKICYKFFKHNSALKCHENIHDVKKFKCQWCARKFTTLGKLNEHSKFHKNPEKYACAVCGHQAKDKSSLMLHLRIHDKNRDKKYKCDQCDFKTDINVNFGKHSKSHEKREAKLKNVPTAIKCKKCPSVLINKNSYNDHLRKVHTKHNKNSECDICGVKLIYKHSVKRHFKEIHKIKL